MKNEAYEHRNNWYQMKLRLLREENERLKQVINQLAASQGKETA